MAVAGVVAALLVRNRLLDADAAHLQDSAAPAEVSWTLGQAVRSPAFWTFSLGTSFYGLVTAGISLFNESILRERGFEASTYYLALVVTTLLGLGANFGGGWLATRWPIQRVMGIGMAVLAAALLGLPHVTTETHVLLYAIAFGIVRQLSIEPVGHGAMHAMQCSQTSARTT